MKARVFIPLVILFAVLVALVPRTAKWAYEYRQGSTWKYETLTSTMEFPILKTEAEMDRERIEKTSETVPYYRFSSDVVSSSIKKAEELDLDAWQGMKVALVSAMTSIYDKGVVPDAGISSSEMIYVQKAKRAEKVPVEEVYRLSEARSGVLEYVLEEFPEYPVDSVFRACGVYDLVMPDLIYDEQLTKLVQSATEDTVSPTEGYVNRGTVIVNQGELITEDIAKILDSYKAEYIRQSEGRSAFKSIAGNAVLVLLVLVCFFFAVRFSNPKIFEDSSRYAFLVTMFAMMSISELLLIRFAPDWIYVFPFTVGAIFLQAFFKNRVIYPVYIVSLFPLLLFADRGAALFILFLVAATVTLSVFAHFSKGAKQFLAALINFLVLAVTYLALRWAGALTGDPYITIGKLFGASFLQVMAYPLVYLMERIFNLVSSSRLQELELMSNSLLRDLEQKAPGTFQHSLQVMNLASAAARAIGADEDLIKAGALYHDIGKIQNPICFVENESLGTGDSRYHEGLTPLQSAQDIIKHVTDGMELARAHKLPAPVSDFIITHHGTNCVAFFYDKFLKEGGDPAQKQEFCYPGVKPQTKEQAILMLCDSLEAASRTLKDHSAESVSNLVEKIAQYKEDDAQFDEADLTLKELATVKSVLKAYLCQINHERIKYPERRNK